MPIHRPTQIHSGTACVLEHLNNFPETIADTKLHNLKVTAFLARIMGTQYHAFRVRPRASGSQRVTNLSPRPGIKRAPLQPRPGIERACPGPRGAGGPSGLAAEAQQSS